MATQDFSESVSGADESGQSMTALVESLRQGRPEAVRELDLHYRPALVRFCKGYLGRADQAEDAVQEVCCKILAADSVPDHFRSWAYKLARNHCLNLLRERSRRKDGQALPPPSMLRDQLTGQLTRLVRQERQERLAELVHSLTLEQSEVLRLRYVEGLSRAEIADVLDVPEPLVKSRLFEGVKALRECAADWESSP